MKRILTAMGLCLMAGSPGAWPQAGGPKTEARVVMLTGYGFEPRQMTVKPGALYLVVRTKLPGGEGWELTEVSSLRAPRAVFPRRGRGVTRQLVTLTPGEYELTDERFPNFKCTIRVEP